MERGMILNSVQNSKDIQFEKDEKYIFRVKLSKMSFFAIARVLIKVWEEWGWGKYL